MSSAPPPMKLVGKPQVSVLTPATTGEIVRDTVRFWFLLLPAGVLTMAAGIIARMLFPSPMGILMTIGVMALTALLLWVPVSLLHRKWFHTFLETHGPMRWGVFVLALTALLLPLMAAGAVLGVGSIDITLSLLGPLGFGLIGTGFALRSGESRHCPSCDYQVPPEGDIPSENCPECGTPWTGKLIKGRRVRSPFLIRLGATLIVLWLAPVALSFIGFGPVIYRYTPTSVLIPWTKMTASTSPKLTPRFTELLARTLTPEQEASLVRHMLDRRMRDGNSPFIAAPWLDGLAGMPGALPGDLRDRALLEAFTPRLVIPQTVITGDTVALHVTGTFRGTFHTLWPWARIEAVIVDGESLPIDGPTDWTYALYLDPSRGPFRDPTNRLTLEVPWTPHRAGAQSVRVTVRLASTMQGTMPGALDDPATPIFWTQTIELEERVVVRPPE